MRVTIKDIARMAGVSISTVSRAINNSKPVGEEARRRVLDALKKTNYPPSVLPEEPGPRRRLIGIVAPHNRNSVLDEFIAGIRDVSRLYGCDIVVTMTDGTVADEAGHLRLFAQIIPQIAVDRDPQMTQHFVNADPDPSDPESSHGHERQIDDKKFYEAHIQDMGDFVQGSQERRHG